MATVIKYKNDKGHKAEFVLTKYLGGGAFGQVYLWHLRRCHINLDFPPTLACKSITFRSEEELEWIKEREVKLWGVSEGKNLIKMYAVVKDEDKVYFFFHFYNGGMLSQLITDII